MSRTSWRLGDDFVGSSNRRIGDRNDGDEVWRTTDRLIEEPSFSPNPYNVKIGVGDKKAVKAVLPVFQGEHVSSHQGACLKPGSSSMRVRRPELTVNRQCRIPITRFIRLAAPGDTEFRRPTAASQIPLAQLPPALDANTICCHRRRA